MAKPRRTAFHLAVYCLVRLLSALVQALPLPAAYGFAGRVAQIAAVINRRHRRVAEENLRHAFGVSLSDNQRRRMVLAVYEHFGKLLVEFLHLPRRFRGANAKRFFEHANLRTALRQVLGERRPTIVVGAHHGNWEVASVLLAAVDLRAFAVARTLDNPYLHRFFLRLRQFNGQTILSKNEDYDRIRQVLADDGILCMLADQSGGPRGYFVDFFGRLASTQRAVALLALEYNARVIVTYTRRLTDSFYYEVGVESLLDPRDYQQERDGAWRLTADMTAALERSIRRAPEQYFWLHNRWKLAPPTRKHRAAA